MQKVVKKSYLKILLKGKNEEQVWQDRFYVLDANKVPRLDWYPNQDTWRTHGPSKTILLQDIIAVTQGSGSVKGEVHTFEIRTHSKLTQQHLEEKSVFAAQNQLEVEEWINHILRLQAMIEKGLAHQSSLPRPTLAIRAEQHTANQEANCMVGNHNSYTATVVETDGVQKCGLTTDKNYLLQVTPMNLLLLELSDDGFRKKILAWPYKYIRRYGRSTHSFTFEAGRKCESGEGLFTFSVEDGETVFKEVHLCTKAMRSKTAPESMKSVTPPTPAGGLSTPRILKTPPATPTSPSNIPTLPKRNYGNANDYKTEETKLTSPPKTPVTEKSKKHDILHNIKDALKVPLKNIGDQISETLHKHKGSSEDISPINSLEEDIHGNIGIVGIAGKYKTSPNMRQRGLPPIPIKESESKTSNAQKTHKRADSGNVENNNVHGNVQASLSSSPNTKVRGLPAIPNQGKNKPEKKFSKSLASDNMYQSAETTTEMCKTVSGQEHQYSLYDDSSAQAASDMYEEKTHLDSGISDYILSRGIPLLPEAMDNKKKTLKPATSTDHGYSEELEDDDGHYSSIDEDKPSPPGSEEYSDPRAFKMSELLSQTKKHSAGLGDNTAAEQEDYSNVSEDYDSIDILKGVDKGGHIRPVSEELTQDESNMYGELSLGPKRGKVIKGDVDYMNTTNRKT